MTSLVQYSLTDGVATITLDDGKRNALSAEMVRQLHDALDRAEADRALVILTGREEIFSAGFDLKTLRGKPGPALKMLHGGFSLPARLLRYPYPVIAACNGHCYAMGVFLMLSADYVIGSRGDFRVCANEVAIGLTMPRVAVAVLRHRLTPAAFQTAVTLAREFPAEQALEAGFFDELAEAPALHQRADEVARESVRLDMPAHKGSKLRIRRSLLRRLRVAIWLDLLNATLLGLRAALGRKQ